MMKIVFIFLFLSFSFISFAKPPSSLPVIMTGSVNGNFTFNNNPKPSELIPIPILFYQNNRFINGKSQLTVISGGLFNQVSWLSDQDGFGFKLGAQSLFVFAGDSVKIDGDDFGESFDFNGNAYGMNAGIQYQSKWKYIPYKFSLGFETSYQHHYARPTNPNYSILDDFWKVGPEAKFEIGIFNPSLPIPKMFKFILLGKYQKRLGYEPWGLNSDLNDKTNQFSFEARLDSKFNLNKKWSFWFITNGSLVSHADRLSALGKGTHVYAQEMDQLFFSQVQVSRFFKVKGLLERELIENQKLNLAFGGVLSTYREILIEDYRDQFAYGFQSSLSSRFIQNKLSWHLDYGFIDGVHDHKWIHEMSFRLAWRFKP